MQSLLNNDSRVSVFTFSALDETLENKYVLLSFTALFYPFVVFCNVTVILTIYLHKKLHEPMYVFICNLCVNGVFGTSGFYPKFMYDLLAREHVISYAGCMMQILVIYAYLMCDFSTLTVMAYDRYVAICKPLEYHSIMTNRKILKCILFCWLPPVICISFLIILIVRLPLCGSIIEKLYCEIWAVAKLSCISTTVNNVFGFIVILTYFGHAVLVFCSYVYLMRKCRKSVEGRKKFIQTCVPHILALMNVTIAMLFDVLFSRYGSKNVPQGLRNFMAMEFLLVPPILNPVIYGLKMTTVRHEMMKMFFKKATGDV